MHGSVHDFVVLRTVKDGANYPTGHGGGALVSTIIKTIKSLKEQPTFEKVLDIGSLDINGNMYDYDFCGVGPKWRDLIKLKEFVGLDLIAGNGVTVVGNAHKMEFESNSFDLVMCLSMIEHDTDPLSTIKEAFRVLKKGQPFLLTTVDEKHPEHKHLGGGDHETYNHITEKQFGEWLKQAGFKNADIYHYECDLFAYCIK